MDFCGVGGEFGEAVDCEVYAGYVNFFLGDFGAGGGGHWVRS